MCEMTALEIVISAATGAISFLSISFICAAFLKMKKMWYSFIPYFLILVSFETFRTRIPLLTLFPQKQIIVLSCYFLFVCLVFDGTVFAKVSCILLGYAILDGIEAIVPAVFINLTGIPREALYSGVFSFIVIVTTSYTMFFIVSFLIWKTFHHHRRLERIELFFIPGYIVLPLVTLTTIIILWRGVLGSPDFSPLVIFDMVGLLVANIVLLLLFHRIEENARIKKSAALIKQQMENQVKTTQALMESHEKQRKLTHDFKHHASVVKNLLEMGEVAQAEEYLEKISQINRINELVVSSGHPIVDTVLNQKYSEAKQQNIEVEFILNDLSNLSLANEDIVILLANLLDNAIEGCMKVEKTRLIRVRIQKEENAALVVAVGNSAAMALEFNEETMQTDKPDSLLHGYGFQNIREVLLKYDAVPAVECRNGWFQFSTVIY